MVASSWWPPLGTETTNVGGIANVWQRSDQDLTRPANTTAYAQFGAIGSGSSVVLSFGDKVNFPSSTPFFRGQNSSGLLTGLRCDVSVSGIATSNMGSVVAWLYQTSPTAASGLTDQGVYQNLVADIGSFLGIALFSTWYGGGSGSNMITSFVAPVLAQMPVIGAASTQSLFAVLMASAAFTPVASAIIHLHASTVGD